MKINKNVFVTYRNIEGEYYIANRYEVYKLNGIGNQIWQLLDEFDEEETIIDALCNTYNGVEKSIIKADMQEFIAELSKKGMVELDG